jgi:hypothetical protein
VAPLGAEPEPFKSLTVSLMVKCDLCSACFNDPPIGYHQVEVVVDTRGFRTIIEGYTLHEIP